jgi:hypothetical protein
LAAKADREVVDALKEKVADFERLVAMQVRVAVLAAAPPPPGEGEQ